MDWLYVRITVGSAIRCVRLKWRQVRLGYVGGWNEKPLTSMTVGIVCARHRPSRAPTFVATQTYASATTAATPLTRKIERESSAPARIETVSCKHRAVVPSGCKSGAAVVGMESSPRSMPLLAQSA